MSNLELVSYKEYPQDQYTKAICTICIDGKYNVAYGKKVTKDGKAFWAPATHSVTDGSVKEYIPGFELDSNKENEKILEFVRNQVKAKIGYVDMPFIQRQEVANEQTLPF